jgi:subtilisin family serine protease
VRGLVTALGGELHFIYGTVFQGFAASLPDTALPGLRRNPLVASIEPDRTVSVVQTAGTQPNPTYGLDRVDQRNLPLSQGYEYTTTASNVTAYVIDTGILATHQDFGGRVVGPGFTAISDGNGSSDCNGHGTHVAGTVGGTTYGVAKGVKLVAVRVLGCNGSGTNSGVIAGIDWVAANATGPSVANLSLGGGASSAVDTAVANAVNRGVVMVVAAGNDNANACNYSPARAPAAITVGATTSTDARASYSNFGSCVDIFAPGSSITSAWHTSNMATNTISGTSMASPHVAGVVALIRSAQPTLKPAEVATVLTRSATPNKVTSAGTGSPNLLAYSLPVELPPLQPVAVASLARTASNSGTLNWVATVTTTVKNTATNATNVAGATVTGRFGSGTAVSCVTSTSGSCAVSAAFNRFTTASTTFTVTGISGQHVTYDATKNGQNSITVARP